MLPRGRPQQGITTFELHSGVTQQGNHNGAPQEAAQCLRGPQRGNTPGDHNRKMRNGGQMKCFGKLWNRKKFGIFDKIGNIATSIPFNSKIAIPEKMIEKV
jgi:hypothetical protein